MTVDRLCVIWDNKRKRKAEWEDELTPARRWPRVCSAVIYVPHTQRARVMRPSRSPPEAECWWRVFVRVCCVSLCAVGGRMFSVNTFVWVRLCDSPALQPNRTRTVLTPTDARTLSDPKPLGLPHPSRCHPPPQHHASECQAKGRRACLSLNTTSQTRQSVDCRHHKL